VAQRGIEVMPRTLLHSLERLVADEVLRAALGRMGERAHIDYVCEIKSAEFGAYHAAVSRWEVERCLALS